MSCVMGGVSCCSGIIQKCKTTGDQFRRERQFSLMGGLIGQRNIIGYKGFLYFHIFRQNEVIIEKIS